MPAAPILVIAAFASASSPTAAPTAIGQMLEPIGHWVLNYADTQCVASREYGDPADPITFGIRPAPNGETYELVIGRNRAGPEFAEELEGSVDFGRGPIKAWLLHFGEKGKKLSAQKFRITAAEMQQARSASSVVFHVKHGTDTRLTLQAIPNLLAGLEKCTADLKRYWNEDGDKTGEIATPPKGEVRSVFNDEDYPSEASNKLQEGTAQYLLLIDEKGSVADCYVQIPSGVPALDAMGCQVIRQRAKFKPARDRNGKPVRSTALTPPVRWRLD